MVGTTTAFKLMFSVYTIFPVSKEIGTTANSILVNTVGKSFRVYFCGKELVLRYIYLRSYLGDPPLYFTMYQRTRRLFRRVVYGKTGRVAG